MVDVGPLPPVSIVIPCRDRQATVAEAVNSVLSQDYPDLQVIAVDDGSQDETRDILHAIDDDRLSMLSNPGPRGPSATRNFGVRHARHDWIAFQDSDDVWLPDRLSAQMPRLAGSAFVAGYCGMLVKPDTNVDTPASDRFPRPGTQPTSGNILPALLRDSFVSTQMLIVRRADFDALGGFDEDLPALVDWELMLRLAGRGPVDFLDRDLVIQRMTDNSITRSGERRVLAQRMIERKHRALFQTDRAAYAQHHHRIAGGQRGLGDYADARRHALRALKARPFNPVYHFALVRALARGVLG